MKKRYRLKVSLPLKGTVASLLQFFPNALTFVAELPEDKAGYIVVVDEFLKPFGVVLTLEEAPVSK